MSGMTRKEAAAGTSRERRGFALESVLLLLVMFTVVVLAGLSAVTSLTRTSNADYRASRVAYAAEGGGDDIMSQLDAAMQDGIINNEDINKLETPVVPGYKITHSTQVIGAPESRTITSGPFAGLYSLNQPIDIQVEARDSASNRAAAILSVNAQTIPLFQFGVFYEGDLEILPGAPMTFAGWVHTNGNLYLSSNSATFESQITTPDSVFWDRKDRNERLSGVKINNAAATPVALDFDSRSHPGASFVTRSQQKFNGRLMTGAHGVRPLKLPLPEGMSPVTLVLPKNAGDEPMVQDVKMAWKADWYIKVPAGLFRLTASQATSRVCDSLDMTRSSGMILPPTATCKKVFKPIANAFYDGREKKSVDLLDINIDSLRIWSDAGASSRAPRIIYIEFEDVNPAHASNDLVAVRIRGGAKLPKPSAASDTGGLTIVTERPMYVLGDYNTQTWRPAALMADAITFLSNPGTPCTSSYSGTGWCDLRQNVAAKKSAKATEVNAAILSGHSATTCDFKRAGCSSPAYGGGLENFPRFLENWSGGIQFKYTGSLVSLYESRFVNGTWAHGGYYDAPTRNWQFDINFRFPERLPPGTPSVGTVIQTAFRPVY